MLVLCQKVRVVYKMLELLKFRKGRDRLHSKAREKSNFPAVCREKTHRAHRALKAGPIAQRHAQACSRNAEMGARILLRAPVGNG